MFRSKSSIRGNLLQQWGHALMRRRVDVAFDRVLLVALLLVVFWSFALAEWIRFWQGTIPDPIVPTLAAAVATFYAVLRSAPLVRRTREERKRLERERPIGEYLDRLRVLGYHVYDDVPGDSGDIDHVVVCTQGVFAIDTALRRRPVVGECIVDFDGNGVSLNGAPFDPAPLVRVKAQAEQLARILKEETGRSYVVRPVLLFPGWNVRDSESPKQSGVWVLNPRSLGKWIDFRPASLHPELVTLAVTRLDAYVRRFD